MLTLVNIIWKNIEKAEKLIWLERAGIRVKYAIDASVIHSYLNIPIDVYCESNKSKHDFIFFNYSSISLLIEHFPKVIQDKLILLPFYEIELEDNINYQKAIIKNKLNRLNKMEVFSENIMKLSNNPVIASIINKKHENLSATELTSEEEQKILNILFKNFSEFYFYLIFNSETLTQQYTYISNNLTTIPNNSLDIDKLSINKTTQNIFTALNLLRNEPEYRYANYVDASSLALVYHINQKQFADANEFLVLISDASSLYSIANSYSKEFEFIYETNEMKSSCAPIVIHPFAILLYLLAREEANDKGKFVLSEIKERIIRFRSKLISGTDMNIKSFIDQVFLEYADNRMSSPIKLEEMQYLIKNKILQKSKFFKQHVSDEVVELLNALSTNEHAWNTYRTNMINTFKKREGYLTRALSQSNKNAKYLTYGIYLFDYDNDEVNDLLEQVTVNDKVDDLFNKLDELKEKGIAEAFHLSAYVKGKLERFPEAFEDIETGAKLCKNPDETRKFEYLRTINLGNKGLLTRALIECTSLANLYGNDFPRFWLHLGFLYWQRARSSFCKTGDLNNAIKYTELAVTLSLKQENKHYKCILLGESNLVRYEVENNNLENAAIHLEILNTKADRYSQEKPATEELPMFSYVNALYNIEIVRKSGGNIDLAVCSEIGKHLMKCEDNLLIVNKNIRNEYIDLIDLYNQLCGNSSTPK